MYRHHHVNIAIDTVLHQQDHLEGTTRVDDARSRRDCYLRRADVAAVAPADQSENVGVIDGIGMIARKIPMLFVATV